MADILFGRCPECEREDVKLHYDKEENRWVLAKHKDGRDKGVACDGEGEEPTRVFRV